jgi:hypothetical protein
LSLYHFYLSLEGVTLLISQSQKILESNWVSLPQLQPNVVQQEDKDLYVRLLERLHQMIY